MDLKRYRVTVSRTEHIALELMARDEDDADDRALSDGEEVFSDTKEIFTISVQEM